MFDIDRVTVDEIAQGWKLDSKASVYHCLYCKKKFEDGIIYRQADKFMTAKRAVIEHGREHHGSPFEQLLNLEKRFIGLTDTQKKLLHLMYQGLSNQEIASKTGNAASTIRAQRFLFKEKTRQAKLMLALASLLESSANRSDLPNPNDDSLSPVHLTAAQIDERFAITAADKASVIKSCVLSHKPLVIKSFPVKEKRKLVLLTLFAEQFEPGRQYSEKEVNDVLKPIYADYVTIRRYLIEYGYLDRTSSGSAYWIKNAPIAKT